MPSLKTGVSCLLAALSVGAAAQKTPHYPIEKYTLKNGLRVVLSEDHSAPIIGLDVAYDVGARNEERGRTGFAHLFEHMMFQGSAHVGKAEHMKYIAANGGTMNGTTRNEITNYYETLPAEKLPLALWLEADRMRSLAVTQANLDNQREVVKEEKRLRYDNQPYAAARQHAQELAFTNFNLQHSVIGSMDDLNAASLADAQAFFKTHYAPNNAVLVLVGDFQPKAAKALIEQYFGVIAPQPQPPKPDLAEPAQAAEKRDTVHDALAKVPALTIAYHAPSKENPDHYALEMLSQVLFEGESSRAYQELVKGRSLALNVEGGTSPDRGPSIFELFALVNNTAKPEELEQGIYALIDAIKQTPPTSEELDRVKTRFRANWYKGFSRFGLESMLGRATVIGDYTVSLNKPELINTDLSGYLRVTPEQIQAVAKKYLTAENRTVITILPGAANPAKTAMGETK